MKTRKLRLRAKLTPVPKPPESAVRIHRDPPSAQETAEKERRLARIRPGLIVNDDGDRISIVIARQKNGQVLLLLMDGTIYSQDVSMFYWEEAAAAPGSPLDLIADGIADLLRPHIKKILWGQPDRDGMVEMFPGEDVEICVEPDRDPFYRFLRAVVDARAAAAATAGRWWGGVGTGAPVEPTVFAQIEVVDQLANKLEDELNSLSLLYINRRRSGGAA